MIGTPSRVRGRLLRRLRQFAYLHATPAQESRFERHLRRYALRSQSRHDVDANVLAILAVESFLRPRPARALEYALWFALSLARRKSVGGLSVGTAQGQLVHWHELGLLEGVDFSARALARVRDPQANYELCRRFLSARRALDEPDAQRLARTYTGGSQRVYVELLSAARATLAPGGARMSPR
jgi:hypothetical protein